MKGKKKNSALVSVSKNTRGRSRNVIPIPRSEIIPSMEKGQAAEYATSSASLSDVVAFAKNMDKDMTTEDKTSDSRMAEDRRLRGVVPAPLASSSYEGQTSEFRASFKDLMAIVQNTLRVIQSEKTNDGNKATSKPIITTMECSTNKILVKKKRNLEESNEVNNGSSISRRMQRSSKEVASESILISSESEENGSQIGTPKRGKKSKCKKRRTSTPKQLQKQDVADEEIETHFLVESKSRLKQKIAGLEIAHTTEVFARMQDWLEKIENMRKKSKNIKGSWSGQMKIFLECCKKAGMVLSIKTSFRNDPEYWKAKFETIKEENLELCCHLDSLEKDLQLMKEREFVKNAYSDGNNSQKNSESPREGKEDRIMREKSLAPAGKPRSIGS